MIMQTETTAGSLSAPALITATELASLLRISTRSLWRMRSAGKIPMPLRLGGAVRWRLDEVQKWIAEGCPILTRSETES